MERKYMPPGGLERATVGKIVAAAVAVVVIEIVVATVLLCCFHGNPVVWLGVIVILGITLIIVAVLTVVFW